MNYHIEYYLIISSIFVCGLNCNTLGDTSQSPLNTQSSVTFASKNNNSPVPDPSQGNTYEELVPTTPYHVTLNNPKDLSDVVSLGNDIDAVVTLSDLDQKKSAHTTKKELLQLPAPPLQNKSLSIEEIINVVPGTVSKSNLLMAKLPLQLLKNISNSDNGDVNSTKLALSSEFNNTITAEEQSFMQWFSIMHKFTEGELKNKNSNIYVIYFINLVLCSIAVMSMILGLFKCYRPRQWLLHTFLKDFRRMINADQLKV